MIKMKPLLKESTWTNRKFGESLPTLEDYMSETYDDENCGDGHAVVSEVDVDDEEAIKYKDKEGEQKQMKAGSAKSMPKDHPAKIEYDKMADKGGDEKEPAGKLGGGDFERPDTSEPEDKPFGGDTGADPDPTRGDPDDAWDDEEGRAKPSPSSGMDKARDLAKKGMKKRPSVDDSRQKAVQSGMALKNAEKEFGKDSSEYGNAKRADDEAQGEYQQAKASQEQRQKDINSGKVEPETKEEAEGAASAAKNSVEKQKQNRAYALQQPDPRDPRSPAEQEAGWDKTVADAEKRAGEAEAKAREFGGGDEDDLEDPAGGKGDAWMHGESEESVTINGKQYKRISESIKPTIYDPNKEIKKSWNRISLRQFDRKWKKEII